MGQIKQMHIDCYPGVCVAPAEYFETCYMQNVDEEPREPGEPMGDSDRDPSIDMDRE